MQYFDIKFLAEAHEFVERLNPKAIRKLLYNIRLARETNDPRIFKKLIDEIWEFRIRDSNTQIRLLAFWDKTNVSQTLVVATHGFIKKTDKVPGNEIERARNIRKKYFEGKK